MKLIANRPTRPPTIMERREMTTLQYVKMPMYNNDYVQLASVYYSAKCIRSSYRSNAFGTRKFTAHWDWPCKDNDEEVSGTALNVTTRS